jgi:hypothetical protein
MAGNEWRKVSNYAITNGTHNICRVVVNGRESFELWQRQGNGWVFVSRHATADGARADAARSQS